MDYLDIDQVMDVPDTPDRLTSQRRNSLAVDDDSENGKLPDRGVLNGLMGNHRPVANNGNGAMKNSSHQGDLDIHDQFKSGISIFSSASDNVSIRDSSKKLPRLEDKVSKKPGVNAFAQTKHADSVLGHKKIPLYIPSISNCSSGDASDGIILGSSSSSVTKRPVSAVKIQDGSRGRVVDFGQKCPSNTLEPTRSRDTRKGLPGQGSSNCRKVLSAHFPRRAFSIQDNDHVMDVDALPEHTSKRETTCSYDTSKNNVPKEMGLGLSLSGVSVRDTQSRSHTSEGFSSLIDGENSFEVSRNARKREIDGTLNGASANMNPVARLNGGNKGKEIDLCRDSQPKTEHAASKPLQTVISPRRIGQKRLVRNGCISPFNIAKSKSSLDSPFKNDNSNKEDGNGKEAFGKPSNGDPSCQIHVISPGSEENRIDKMKGKGLMVDVIQANDGVIGTRSSSRELLIPRVEDVDTRAENGNDFRSAEAIGWRSTRNRSKVTYMPSSHGIHLSERNVSAFSSYDRDNESRIEDIDQVMVENDSPENGLVGLKDPVSFQHAVPNSRQVQASSIIISELDTENDRHRGKQKLMKRLRKSTSARNSGESSTATSDDPEVSCLLSSGQFPISRSARTRNSQRRGIPGPIIEVDELFSPETRHSNLQVSCNQDSDATARQVEADEILARQLQEEFYHELPGIGVGEIDSSIAWALQHEDDAHHFPFSESRRLLLPRDSSSGNLYRNQRSQSFQNSSARSTNRVRGSSSTRMAQLRRNFHGRSPLQSSRGSSLRFPPNMNFEMRLDILEALEAAVGNRNGMTMVDPLFHVQRDFNENDYEMLLALDEDNHRHVGASDNQINSLPQSIVQTDNFEEACAICLETPSNGDTIRHLPCLHKFHKECIDPWLRRKTSCPTCTGELKLLYNESSQAFLYR
eukprot:TRINITY_DN1364_c1_g1_i5.p1 TRINITY_DN1364_c1_g1~~TRINITY_DN1364_c1_g1_i5.p1  ORF type:complete len:918 (-),score=203.59 TRINITY_DN1364_c1_g1_i5:500-3253(-)